MDRVADTLRSLRARVVGFQEACSPTDDAMRSVLDQVSSSVPRPSSDSRSASMTALSTAVSTCRSPCACPASSISSSGASSVDGFQRPEVGQRGSSRSAPLRTLRLDRRVVASDRRDQAPSEDRHGRHLARRCVRRPWSHHHPTRRTRQSRRASFSRVTATSSAAFDPLVASADGVSL